MTIPRVSVSFTSEDNSKALASLTVYLDIWDDPEHFQAW